MRLLTYNILESGEGRIDPLAEVIRQAAADVVVLQEAYDRALMTRLADRVAMELFIAENPRSPTGAVALLSRLEIVEAVNHAPLQPALTRSALHARVRQGGAELTIVGLHLHARETLADEQVRLAELPAVLGIAAPFAGQPHVLAGDFNTSHPEQIIDIARLRPSARERIAPQGNVLPREVIRRILAAGYVDAHAIGRQPADFQCSFTTAHPALRVDFIFVPPPLAPRVQRCAVLTPPIGRFASDHFPVLAEID